SHLHDGSYVQYKCKNGLWDVGVPILIADDHVATLFLGQFFYDDETIDRDFFRRLGTECGFDLDAYLAALSQVPVMSRKSVADIMAYYTNFVGFLADTGLARLKQQEAEQSLRRSEERFRTLFESSSDMIAIIDPDGTIRASSPAISQLLGYLPDEKVGTNIFDHVHPDDIPLAQDAFSTFLAEPGATSRLVNRLAAGDGTWRVCETVGRNLLHDPTIKGLLFNVRDVTERHKAETALKKSQEMFSRIFATAPIPISISTLSDGRYVEVNRAFERATGYWREEVIGKVATDLPIWNDPGERTRLLEILREKGEVYNFEFMAHDKGGRRRTGLLSACVVELDGQRCVIVLNNEITELKEAEEALKKSEEKFSRAFNTSPIPLAITRAADGAFLEVNRSFEVLTGYTREEALGRSAIELGLCHDPTSRERMVASLMEAGELNNFEFTIRTRAGIVRTVLMSACIINLHGEKCILGLTTDITERKQAEEEIEALNRNLATRAADLESANRELEAFGYSLSHDLKNPLSRVYISAQELRNEYAECLGENGQKFVEYICEASEKMAGLITAMLDLSRLARKDLDRQETDLGELARIVSLELQMAEPERKVEFVLEKNLRVSGDSALLKVALENLMGNAWKYTARVPDACIEFGTTLRDGEKIFFVRDNGAGFAMEEVGRLFQPFQRLHREDEFAGSGIGLATVQRIIHRHG
ncbi:MAG TPA: PAS domain S-box protein, partial [Geobacteraceae bacterium]